MHEPRTIAECTGKVFATGAMNVSDRDLRSFENLGEQAAGSTIDIVNGEDFIARLQQASNRRDGRQSAGKGKGARSMFEFGELLFQNGARWIAAARIVVFTELE